MIPIDKYSDATEVPVFDPSRLNILMQLEDPASELSQRWDREHDQHVMCRLLEMIGPDFEPTTWQACWEHVVQERPAPEVAAELGLTIGAVYAAKVRVLGRLREELQGMLD